MSRVLARLSVAVAVAAVGLAGVPAAADPATVAATAAPYLVRVGDMVDGLVLQANAAAPDSSLQSEYHYGSPDPHIGWGATLFDVRAEAHVRGDGSSMGFAKTHFALRDFWFEDPFFRLNSVSYGVSCDHTATWVGGASGLTMHGRRGGIPQELGITFDQPITLDPVHPGDVYFPDRFDYRITTVTLSRVTTLADLAGYPQFAHYDTANAVRGYRLRVEQRETASSPAKVYEFLIGVVVCRL